MTDPSQSALPPLPSPDFRLWWNSAAAAYKVNKPNIDEADVYTANQMRAYALAALAAQPQAEPSSATVPSDQELLDLAKMVGLAPRSNFPGESPHWILMAGDLRAFWNAAQPAVLALAAPAVPEPTGWREALQFYADRDHFMLADESAWDTVSGEPANFWCDEAGTATVEDGSVAAAALKGTPAAQSADAVTLMQAANVLEWAGKRFGDRGDCPMQAAEATEFAAKLRAISQSADACSFGAFGSALNKACLPTIREKREAADALAAVEAELAKVREVRAIVNMWSRHPHPNGDEFMQRIAAAAKAEPAED